MGVRIVPKRPLELKLRDKDFQKRAIDQVEAARPKSSMKTGGKVTKKSVTKVAKKVVKTATKKKK